MSQLDQRPDAQLQIKTSSQLQIKNKQKMWELHWAYV